MKILPVLYVHPDKVQEYWQTLYVHDTLKYRLCDIEDPAWEDVVEMINRMGRGMYLVFEGDKAIGEFALENKTGRAFQAHFSTHPEISFDKRLQIGRDCVTWVLEEWKNPENKENFVSALYGLTPLKNRVACMYALKIGFKKIGVLPKGVTYMGKDVDAMISVASNG